jgi:glycosyltransferase involved in cell wall biosynthesis
LRIAIATDWFAPRRGGIESQLLQLAEGLGTRGHDVDVITSTPGALDGRAFRARPLGVATLRGSDVAISPALIPALHRELRRGYDVVHAHVSVVSPVGYAAAAVARSLGLPTVVTFHSLLRYKSHLLRAANAVFEIGRGAAIWSGVSELVARQLRVALSSSDVVVLPNGIDCAFWQSAAPNAAERERRLTLVSTIRLNRKKRPRQLVDAFAQAAARANVPARLIIAGDGPERRALERDIAIRGLGNGSIRVELVGWLDRRELRSLYAAADGFVLPSKRESFGIAALEARAAGLPVIGMRDSGSSEFLQHGADALLSSDDIELSHNIERFIADAKLRARLIKAPTSLERYDWSVVLAVHAEVYSSAMRRASVAAGAVAASA